MIKAQKIFIEVSAYEAAMIKKIRLYNFGTFQVIKMNGDPRRVILGGSETLDENEGLDLAVDLSTINIKKSC